MNFAKNIGAGAVQGAVIAMVFTLLLHLLGPGWFAKIAACILRGN